MSRSRRLPVQETSSFRTFYQYCFRNSGGDMRKNTEMIVCVVLVLAFGVGSALAQNGNPCPGDKEYQINIIGVPKDKHPDMTNNGHRIFVPLNRSANIYMTGDTDPDTAGLQCGDSFYVADA